MWRCVQVLEACEAKGIISAPQRHQLVTELAAKLSEDADFGAQR
jgi:hypothetical protein